MSAAWFMLALTQWNLHIAVLSTLPLVACLILMMRSSSVWFIYAAVLALPYLAMVITQIVMPMEGKLYAIACLAFGLGFLALLGVNSRKLRALNRVE